MGQLPKSRIAQLKREKRIAKAAKKRKENTRQKIVRFLIVCEGKKTEPNYFKNLVSNNYSEVREEHIAGEGQSTCALVKRAQSLREELERKHGLKFDRVWVVFDKDDFKDFNEAISLSDEYGFGCAWSNEAFELWYLLHFVFLDTAINRASYITKLEENIRKHDGYGTYRYEKNSPNIYQIITGLGEEALAKRYSARLREKYGDDKDFKTHSPCTTVDFLVDELENPERVLKEIERISCNG